MNRADNQLIAIEALDRAIAALTDEVEQISPQPFPPALLHRSCAQELRRIESALGIRVPGLLGATAHAIDEALLAITEARQALQTEGQS